MEQVKNDKIFFHVFPTLKVEEDIRILFADVEVKKITTNTRRDFLHVYIFSRHLIQKKQIRLMEQRIKDQLFGKVAVDVQIEEDYALSGQYTPEALMREYHDSIVMELSDVSVLAASMFSQAKIRYEEENVVCLELLDTIVSEGRKEEILNLLNRLFNERFHIPADIRVVYREPDGKGSREYDEQRIQQEINAIFERRARQRGEYVPANGGNAQDGADGEEGEAKASASGTSRGSSAAGASGKGSGGSASRGGSGSAASGKGKGASGENGKKGFGKGGFKKKDFYRPVKIGDDPNLIYGKNFDDEPITLEQVVTEMGEITVHV